MPFDKPEFDPLLDPGLSTLSLGQVRQKCVTEFVGNDVRQQLMVGLELLVHKLAVFGISAELWIDGSFLTLDPSPRDVDVALAISDAILDAPTDQQAKGLEWLEDADQ